ncbi:MAG: response regulator [Halofilum sp. (in: g-proteobacteria)]|nr:response regulator [Halofilum sp. (in: g-proteobacteria)]
MATVLVVDDSPTEQHVCRKILERHGFEVESVEDGEHSLERARELRPDVILMDVVMPGMNGFQATRQLVRTPETSHIPVIIITTKDQETDRVWGMRQGARDYIVKPVREDALVAAVKAVLEGQGT